jgi:hypothetical protein
MDSFKIEELRNMVLDLKVLECNCERDNWKNEDYILEYNELIDKILDYLKRYL